MRLSCSAAGHFGLRVGEGSQKGEVGSGSCAPTTSLVSMPRRQSEKPNVSRRTSRSSVSGATKSFSTKTTAFSFRRRSPDVMSPRRTRSGRRVRCSRATAAAYDRARLLICSAVRASTCWMRCCSAAVRDGGQPDVPSHAQAGRRAVASHWGPCHLRSGGSRRSSGSCVLLWRCGSPSQLFHCSHV